MQWKRWICCLSKQTDPQEFVSLDVAHTAQQPYQTIPTPWGFIVCFQKATHMAVMTIDSLKKETVTVEMDQCCIDPKFQIVGSLQFQITLYSAPTMHVLATWNVLNSLVGTFQANLRLMPCDFKLFYMFEKCLIVSSLHSLHCVCAKTGILQFVQPMITRVHAAQPYKQYMLLHNNTEQRCFILDQNGSILEKISLCSSIHVNPFSKSICCLFYLNQLQLISDLDESNLDKSSLDKSNLNKSSLDKSNLDNAVVLFKTKFPKSNTQAKQQCFWTRDGDVVAFDGTSWFCILNNTFTFNLRHTIQTRIFETSDWIVVQDGLLHCRRDVVRNMPFTYIRFPCNVKHAVASADDSIAVCLLENGEIFGVLHSSRNLFQIPFPLTMKSNSLYCTCFLLGVDVIAVNQAHLIVWNCNQVVFIPFLIC